MKKHKFVSMLLVLALAIGLLIPVSYAATSTGTGIGVSNNVNHWINRINHNGKEYVYKPAVLDDHLVYCVDLGYSFNSKSEAFRASYKWTKGTGADADAVLERALTISGMDNFDAETLENAKWLMSFVNRTYTLDEAALGEAMMAVQTYLWDHMVRKEHGDVADEDSNIDDGGYADQDTYEYYKSFYSELLKIKAQEEADLEAALAEKLAAGYSAYIAVDQSTKWAIYATSGVNGRQSFFNYFEEKKLFTDDIPDQPTPTPTPTPPPPNDSSLIVQKLCSKTNQLLPGATIHIEGIDVAYETTVTTGADGTAVVQGKIPVGSYRLTEIDPPEGYLPSGQVETIYYNGQESITVSFVNDPLAELTIQKLDDDNGEPVSAVFDVFLDGQLYDTIRVNGQATLTGLKEGMYTFVEVSSPGNYILNSTPHPIHVAPGEKATAYYDLIVTNQRKPGLEILKYDLATKKPLPGVTFAIYHDSVLYGEFTTDETGRIYLNDVDPGTWTAQEIATSDGHILNPTPQQIELVPGDTVKTLVFFNQQKPGMWLVKVDSADLSKRIPNVKFRIEAVDGSFGPEEFTTDENGEIDLSKLDPGAYVVTELECPGYVIDEAQRIIQLQPDQQAEFVFTNSKRPSITLRKLDSYDSTPLGGVTFRIAKIEDGTHYIDRVTDHNGEIYVEDLDPGVYSVTEIDVPEGYILNTGEWHVELFPGKDSTLVVTNDRKSDLTIRKTDKDTGEPVPGVTFTLKKADGPTITTEPTGADGTVTIPRLEPGVYTVTEQSVPEGYILDPTPQMVTLFPNRNATVQFQNHQRPFLTIKKVDINGKLLSGAIFEVKTKAGVKIGDFPVDANGTVTISNVHLDEGYYIITEIQAPEGYILDPTPHEVYLRPGKTTEISIENEKKPDLTIYKLDSVTGYGIKGAKFEIFVSKDKNQNGTYQKLDSSYHYTDANGIIRLENLDTGWYKIVEVEPAAGYSMKEPHEQIVYVEHDTAVEVTFENTPLNAIVLEKYDSVTGAALQGATFQLRYLGGTSGTGGTVIGQKVTDKNGIAMWTGLKPGAYVLEELDPADGYSIIQSSETIFLADSGEQSVVTVRFENLPDGILLIRKVCSVNPSVTLQDAEFKVMYADGTLIGDSNGIYRTDENGEIRIEGLQPGKSVVVTETKAPDGFIIDTQSQTVQIKGGRAVSLTFKNQPKGGIIIQKRDSVTGQPLSGAQFRVTTAAGCEVGLDGVLGTATLTQNGIFTTDSSGEIRISNLAPGAYVITEIKAPAGYVMDAPSTNVVVGGNGDIQTVVITNTPKGGLIVTKYDSVSKQPIPGAQFKITTASGELVASNEGLTSSNGIYTTDANGQIVLSKLDPNTYIVTETKAPEGYISDPMPQTVVVHAGDTQSLSFYNEPLCSLTITKLDSVTGKPVPGTVFTVKDGNGTVFGSFTTGKDGTVTVTGLVPGSTVVVTETKVPTGYVLDPTPQTIIVKNGGNSVTSNVVSGSSGSGVTSGTVGGNSGNNDLTFENDPTMTLTIHKYIEGTANEPLAGVAFKIVDGSGAPVGPGDGVFYTDKAGEISVSGIEPGTTVTVREIKTVEGYVLDGTPKTITVKAGQAPHLTFWNQKAGELVIRKLDSVTKQPLSRVEFQLTYAGGGFVDNANGHLSSNGLYTTDANGEIRISGVTGTIVAKETRTIPGYTIDEATRTQTVVVRPEDTQTLTFYNHPNQTLTIQKYVDGTTDPISGVTFLVTDSSGAVVGPNNGEYVTDRNGRIVLTDLTPGVTITARETRTASGYVLDTTPQSILIKQGAAQTLTFYNKADGGLELIKVNEADKTERIPGVTFEIRRMDGGLVDTVTTDQNGRVHIDLDAGSYYAVETEAAEGFKLDSTPHYFTIQDGKTTTLTVTNKAFSGILIHKTDSVTGKGIYGVTFLLYDSGNTPIGQYTSDDQGYVYIENLTRSGRYYLRELENEGYVPDTQMKTVYVTAGETTLVEWENTPITGQIQILKTSAEYNSMNGWPAGTPIPNTVFEIYHYRTGNLVDTIQTDKNGVAVSRPLPLGRYKIVESKAADFYGLDKTPIEVEIEFAGQIVKAAMTNKPLYTNVSIKKTGYVEVMPGQSIRYDFTGIANNSTTALTSFYWRDTLPVNAVRLDKIVTGTYNVQGNYKIVYKTNLSGGSYRTLADNLSTMQNYVLDASPVALGLASNEYVTEFMVSFGVVPPNFRQVEAPRVYCNVVSWLTGGFQFVNQADVGGVYDGQWIMATTRWVTRVYKPSEPLPRTGY